MGDVRSCLLALRALDSESHLKCRLQSNPGRVGKEGERERKERKEGGDNYYYETLGIC